MTPMDVIMHLDCADQFETLMAIDPGDVEDERLAKCLDRVQVQLEEALEELVRVAEIRHYDWTEERRYL